MMDDRTADEMARLIERLKDEAREEGRRAGHVEAKAALESLLTNFEALIEPPPKSIRKPRTAPPAGLDLMVTHAVSELAVQHREGSDPHSIAAHLMATGQETVEVGQVRQVLRQLTLAGTVLRMALGRYLPAPTTAALAAE